MNADELYDILEEGAEIAVAAYNDLIHSLLADLAESNDVFRTSVAACVCLAMLLERQVSDNTDMPEIVDAYRSMLAPMIEDLVESEGNITAFADLPFPIKDDNDREPN